MSTHMTPPPAAPAFLASAGWEGALIEPLAGDASFRRYFRVIDGDRAAVLMDAPPPHEDVRPFVAMTRYLREIGLRAPAIHHSDVARGLLLIEDFGSDRMREAVEGNPAYETGIYEGVVDVLVALHAHQPPTHLQVHSLNQMIEEVSLFLDWYCPALGLHVDLAGFALAWRAVLLPIVGSIDHPVTELRDFHAENVMLIKGQEGTSRFGLLDFQDAMIGHPAYDLVSILQDARRDVPPLVEAAMIARYCAATGHDGEFETAYWILGAQRNTRILGLFVRLWKRDQKPHYTAFQERMWGLVERDLMNPALGPVRAWFDENIPRGMRASYWKGFSL